MPTPILSIEDLHIHFDTYSGKAHAVNGMSFEIMPGEIFGLVGESGCGKSLTSLAALRMVRPPGRVVNGRIRFQGQDIMQKSEAEMNEIRGGQIAMIFQNPTASLNPVFTVGNQIMRLLDLHTDLDKTQAKERALHLFELVGLPNPQRIFEAYPFNLSGGMQQRVMIAMALSSEARLLIADEPTTALDVTIQAQILSLLTELREKENLSILFITHDLGVVAETCDRVGVAYAGRIVEIGSIDDVLYETKHPYTKGLLGAMPDLIPHGQPLQVISGSVPDGLNPVAGCPFHPRCPDVMDVCRTHESPFISVGENTHLATCHLYGKEVVS
ncbi:ABC transporter ATP-binding protein [Candidatus Leptofilum sp.]|uniref:ABC transporter ATP-binding protein n=1 Tax=Candidatus Leptofilum sp. TaxID=3241576 RepID=UPI003B5A3773